MTFCGSGANLIVSLRQNGVGTVFFRADAILAKGHEHQEKTGYKFDAGFVLQ